MKRDIKIWTAIDVATKQEAMRLLEMLLSAGIRRIKLGLELLSSQDREEVLIAAVHYGFEIFWDGKIYDIPNTVGKTAKVISDRGVAMFNVHAFSGRLAVEAAVANKGSSKVLAVTLLTSLNKKDLKDFGYPDSISTDVVVRALATMSAECGVDGFIGSAQEAPMFRSIMPTARIVTPAIRPAFAAVGDQKRATTPTEAILAGATDLVIGRPITNPPPEVGSSANALDLILKEIAAIPEG